MARTRIPTCPAPFRSLISPGPGPRGPNPPSRPPPPPRPGAPDAHLRASPSPGPCARPLTWSRWGRRGSPLATPQPRGGRWPRVPRVLPRAGLVCGSLLRGGWEPAALILEFLAADPGGTAGSAPSARCLQEMAWKCQVWGLLAFPCAVPVGGRGSPVDHSWCPLPAGRPLPASLAGIPPCLLMRGSLEPCRCRLVVPVSRHLGCAGAAGTHELTDCSGLVERPQVEESPWERVGWRRAR